MCGKKKKNDDTDRTPCRFFFFGMKTNVWMRHIGGAPATTHHVLGAQRGATQARGTQESE